MKKHLFLTIIFFTLISVNPVRADVVNPSYLIKHCPSNKIEKICSFSSTEPFGPVVSSDCAQYEKNPSCYYLAGYVSSFGGHDKYCCDPGYENSFHIFLSWSKKTILTLLLTILLELLVFWAFGFKSKKALLLVALANAPTVISFSALSVWLSGFSFVLLFELFIFIFEAIFLTVFLKEFGAKRIILATLIANVISATIGTILYLFLLNLGIII